MKKLGVLCLAASLVSPVMGNTDDLPYMDPGLSPSARADDLLARMTTQEKVAQMLTVWKQRETFDDSGEFVAEKASEILQHGIGHIGRPSENKSPEQTVAFTNSVQKWLIENTRLGIPAIFHEEALHGHMASGATSFPQAIALASTWQPDLLEKVYTVSAQEVRARGGNQALTPILDIARDPRWGRIEETMGEDPYLVTELGVASVRGFQGQGETLASDRVNATLKHLTGHGQPMAGMNIAPAPMGERELREVFLPPFEAAIKLADARSVMASYNEIDGIPSHANHQLLTTILREEWGFDGILVSDYFAVNELITRHRLAGTKAKAAKMALHAGVDIEMPDPDAFPALLTLVESGELEEQALDVAVKRILTEKFRMGLFETPYTPEGKADAFIGNDTHRALALQVAEQSVVLLKNDGILPLDPTAYKRVAVIGPHADETLLGGYSDVPRRTTSIFQGIQAYLGDTASVTHALGTLITEPFDTPDAEGLKAGTLSKQRWNTDENPLASAQSKQGLMEQAVQLAASSDLVVLVLGGNEGTSREAWADNHLGDRSTLSLLGDQVELAKAVIATQTPVVLVLSNGRPVTLGELNMLAPAIVETWYLGQETGEALAKVLFGDVNPGGKLPVTFPKNVGQLPLFYNHKPSARRGYAFSDTQPQYPFGHGLSYTTFDYQNLKIGSHQPQAGGTIDVELTLTNTGDRYGEEVVQFYVHDQMALVTRPVKELKGFKRVGLKPGQSVQLQWQLPVNLLAYYDADMNLIVEPGTVSVMIGSSSEDIRLSGSVDIAGDTTILSPDDKVFLSHVDVAPVK